MLPAHLAALGWAAGRWSTVVGGEAVTEQVRWVAPLGLSIDLRLDAFSLAMVLLVSGIGTLVCWYSTRYFGPNRDGVSRLAGLLTLFAGAMLGLVLSDHLLTLFVFWELTTITSYLLIGNDDRDPRARAAALQAILVTGIGGLAMLAGFVLLGQAAGTYRISELLAAPPTGGTVPAALVLVLVGAFSKSAQYPFHSWLPGAMVAPTPVSAYLHSATMVKAGVYLVARLAPAVATTGPWRVLVVTVGLTTMVAGALRALRQHDLKLLLAFGTVSQLGFLTVLFGLGLVKVGTAAIVVILAHGLFKAALFMVVGIIDHQAHTRDLRALALHTPPWRPTAAVALLAAASMAGLPPLLGFIGKEKAYDAVHAGGVTGSAAVLAVLVAASALTFAYSARFLWGAFYRSERDDPEAPAPVDDAPAPSAAFLSAPALLAALSLALGLVPSVLDGLVTAATQVLHPGAKPVQVRLWTGVNEALVLSAVTVGLGVLLFAARAPVGRVLAIGRRVPSGGDAFLAVLKAVNLAADRVTGFFQNGSFPIYGGVILFAAAVAPGTVLLLRVDWPGWPRLWDQRIHVVVTILVAIGAVGAVLARRRFMAALFLGSTGYGMALLFAIQGAPDLALTQFAIETLSVVLFVLVLRLLPDRFPPVRFRSGRLLRAAVAGTVGLVVFGFTIVANGSRVEPPISGGFFERAPEAEGRNVVNLILVDFRGLDTLGEVTVLTTAAVGAVSLARVARRAKGASRR